MSRRDETIRVGAVAYHERVVPIWETFKGYFEAAGVPTDYILYSNYERLVRALLDGEVDIGWNTNTAYIQVEHALGGGSRILGMRDIDADYASLIVARRADESDDLNRLAGKRLALGSRDSGHAAILPLYYLKQQGLDAEHDCELVRFDTDLGKHGDTGDSELRVVRAVASGDADAGALGDATWVRLKAEGLAPDDLAVVWKTPRYYHCNFTTLPSFDRQRAVAWTEALLAMDYNDARLRHAMDLEGVKRWLRGDAVGYADLHTAMLDQGYI